MRFDWQTALNGLRLLELAHDRYRHTESELVATRPNGEARYDALLRLYGLAIGAVTWIRGLDDWCTGREGGCELPDYKNALVVWDHDSVPGQIINTGRPNGSAELLLASRFVANKAIHVFATFARTTPVWNLPGGMDPDQFGLPVWIRPSALPPDSALGRLDPAGRAAYERVLAGNKIGWSLEVLRGHFHWWLVELGRDA